MPIATGLALGLGLAAAGGGVASAAIGSHAAGKAADKQVDAANYAANLQKQSSDQALAFQQKEFDTQQKNLAPWLTQGTGAVNRLGQLLSTPGEGLLSQFTPPTLEQAQSNPGYQFALDQGTQALDKSAAAKGNLFSGTQGTALQAFGQNLGEQNYTDVYNRLFNNFQTSQTNEFNRLGSLAGLGQQTATTLGSEGQAAAQNSGNIVQNSAASQSQDAQNAAAARASGYVGGANAWSSAIPGITQAASIPLYSQLLRGAGSAGWDPSQFLG